MEFKKSKKGFKIIIWLVCLIVVGVLFKILYDYQPEEKLPTRACFLSDVCVDLELAITDEEQRIGLMNRENLPTNAGMLFIYDSDSVKKFWMKNTLISLDIIWLDESDRIVHIESDVPICKKDPCDIYGPDFPARNVLEVNAGFVEENDVWIGDRIRFK